MKRILAFFVLGCAAFAQTTIYTGQVKDLSLTPVPNGQVTFDLQPGTDTTMSGTARFTPSSVTCSIIVGGFLKALDGVNPCTIVSNTALSPGGTSYRICIQPYYAQSGACFNDYALGGSKDISTIVPTPTTAPSQTFVDTFSTQTISGTKTFTSPVLDTPIINTPTFTGTADTGTLTAGTGILNTANTWGAKQTLNVGVANTGTGAKHVRVTNPCSTAGGAGSLCTATITWPGTAWADTSYTAVCNLDSPTANGAVVTGSKTTTQMNIQIGNVTTTAITASIVNCIAIHD